MEGLTWESPGETCGTNGQGATAHADEPVGRFVLQTLRAGGVCGAVISGLIVSMRQQTFDLITSPENRDGSCAVIVEDVRKRVIRSSQCWRSVFHQFVRAPPSPPRSEHKSN